MARSHCVTCAEVHVSIRVVVGRVILFCDLFVLCCE
jgi:hypothetical protein